MFLLKNHKFGVVTPLWKMSDILFHHPSSADRGCVSCKFCQARNFVEETFLKIREKAYPYLRGFSTGVVELSIPE
jgi:hypothetical protein